MGVDPRGRTHVWWGVVSGSVHGREGGRDGIRTSVKSASKWVSYAAPSSPVSDS